MEKIFGICTFDYERIDPREPTFSVEVSDTIHGDLDFSFNLVRDFSMTSPFWSKSLKVTDVLDNGHSAGVGNVRYFTTNRRSYSEILLHVDFDEKSFTYGLLSMSPALLCGAVTKVSFASVDTESFKVTWKCIFQPVFDAPAVIASIKSGQNAAYKGLIKAVQCFNKPVLGVASITLAKGSAQPIAKYIGVRVAHGPEKTVKTNPDGSPKEILHVEHSIRSYDDQVIVTLYERSLIGNDTLLATGFLPVRKLDTNRTSPTIMMKDPAGNDVGQYKLGTSVKWHHPEPTESETEFGMAAFAVFDVIKREVMKIAVNSVTNMDESKPYKYSEYDSSLGKMPKYCSVLPRAEVIVPKRIAELFQRNTEYVYSQAPILGLMGILNGIPCKPKEAETSRQKEVLKAAVPTLNDPFTAPFQGKWIDEPTSVVQRLKDPIQSDLEFCAQLLRGSNPMMITMAQSVDELPIDLQGLRDPLGRDTATLISSKSLLFCNYEILAVGDYDAELGVYTNQAQNINGNGTMGPLKFWYAPFLAVFKNEEGKLDILGFILTRFKEKANIVYNRTTTPPTLYKLAKLHLACADNQEHQFVEHLGFAHLCMEPFAIAVHNAFPPGEKRHPIGQLLHPHFQDTIGINFLARQTLVSEVAPFTDTTFSTGTTNGMRIFSQAYKKYDFIQSNFGNALKYRGFDEECSDGIEGFYYRDDGFRLWNILLTHFSRIIKILYGTDVAVSIDRALDVWCMEMRDSAKANIPSFPVHFLTMKQLAEAVTTIVFQCSAQHAAVNYSQLRYVTYVPNRPDNMRLPMLQPGEGKDIDEDLLYAALPTLAAGQFQTMFAYLLTTPPDNAFSEYTTLIKAYPEEIENMLREMRVLSKSIRKRNEALIEQGDIPYEYLDPMGLAQSINI